MDESRFKIVFQKLTELTDGESSVERAAAIEADALRSESAEIAELRKLSAELAEPPTKFFTGT